MSEDKGFHKVAAISALLMAFFMIGNAVTIVMALKDPTLAFSDAAAMLSLGGSAARLFHVSMVFDVLAYLAFAPVVVFCWTWLKARREGLASLFAFCGLAYALLGSIGGVAVDAVMPQMMARYASAGTTEQAMMQVAARVLNQAVAHGVWNPLEVLMVSTWFVGFAFFLWGEKRGLAVLALVIGAVGLLDPIGWALGSDTVLTVGAAGTALMPVWAIWFAIDVLRTSAQAGRLAARGGALD